jgi:hypothetical protein
MKCLLFTLLPFMYFSQDIHIKIPDKKLLHIKPMEISSICFNIQNSSMKKYALAFDQTGFNSIPNEVIDSPYLGLPFFRIYKDLSKLKGESGSSPYEISPIEHDSIRKEDLERYKKENKIKLNTLSDLTISYEINKRILLLEPREIKQVCMNLSLPIYNSPSDSGSLFYDLKEGEQYFFQISLNVPNKILKKYISKSHKSVDDYLLFSGSVQSNKIPFIYK